MRYVRIVFAVIFGGFLGSSVSNFFKGDIGTGLGLFAIGMFFAVFYLTFWIVGVK